MKKFSRNLLRILALICFIGLSYSSFSDGPPPPPPGSGGAGGTDGTRNGAPIDGGLGILLAMGAMYGGKKLYQARKEKKEVEAPNE